MIERFRFLAGRFRRLRAARYFPSDGKVPKGSPGDAADGHFVPIGPLTPGPPFTGVTPWVRQKISGAKNLSGGQRFLPGHRALGLQNLELLRFQNCAWLCRANAPGANPGGRPKGLPYPIPEEFLENRRGGACPSRGPVWDRPLRKEGTVRRRGGIPGLPFFPAVSLRTCGKHGKIPGQKPPCLRF